MLMLCWSCAQVRSLPGGEKDLAPPVALLADPPNLTSNFQGNEIEIVFDEYIQLNNIQQELIVSPPQKKFPDIRVKQKSVVLKFNDELLPNTTYQINFGDGIADVNENNKVQNLVYIFSTGNVIDSLKIHGSVRNVESDSPGEKYKVLLFENDTAVFSQKMNPLYFTKTKSDGSFILSYLKAGNYHLVALDDLNSNYHWDEGEPLAMINESFEIPRPDSATTLLHASTPLPELPDVTSFVADSTGILKLPLDPHFRNLKVKRLNGESVDIIVDRDSLFSVLTGAPTEKFEDVQLEFDTLVVDTLNVPFFAAAQKQKAKLYTDTPQKISSTQEIRIYSNRPILLLDEKSIKVKVDSLQVGGTIEKTGNQFGFVIKALIPPGKSAEITIPPGTFATRDGAGHDSLFIKTYLYRPEELGTVILNVQALNYVGKLLLILSDKNDKPVLKTLINAQEEITIRNLPAGDYVAKVIEDVNQNQLYDPINLKRKSVPEITHIFSGKINVRSNWELKLSWKIE